MSQRNTSQREDLTYDDASTLDSPTPENELSEELKYGRKGTCAEQLTGWVQKWRASLRGRRLFTLLAVVNLVNYVDRGIIPGGSEEFNAFIQGAVHTARPDVYLGILQSGFILGFSAACVIFASLARRRSPFTLMGAGLGMWCVAAVLAGLAKPTGSYGFLLLARLLSGVGEASFVTVVPPLITDTAPPGERGLWLALFYTAQPMGAGMGYVYGSVMATSTLGWPWAFYLEAILMAPLAVACALVPHGRAMTVHNASDLVSPSGSGSYASTSINSTGTGYIGNAKPHQSHMVSPGRGQAGGDSSPRMEESSPERHAGLLDRRKKRPRSTSVGVREEKDGGEALHSSGLSGHGSGRPVGEKGVDPEVSVGRQKHATEPDGGLESGGACVVVSPPRGVTEGGVEEGWNEHAAVASFAFGDPTVATGGGALTKDVLEVTDQPVFCFVVLGAAATAAVTAGMSTFGTSFVTSLEFLTSERAAAATFGCVICAAGLAGTPAGGALIDATDPEGRLGDEKKLAMVLTQATVIMCGATVLLATSTLQSSLIPFLFFFFFGGALLFATAAHSNLAVMFASPKHLRPLAIAVNSIVLHALGDVPSPTLIGWMKDTLAPHCVAGGGLPGAGSGGASGIAGFATGPVELDVNGVWSGAGFGLGGSSRGVLGGISDACRSERRGLHVSLLVIALWLLWTCLFFGIARAVQESALEHGLVPASWGDIGVLISKGLLRPRWPWPWPCRWKGASRARRRGGFGPRQPSLWTDDVNEEECNGVGPSLEQPLLQPGPSLSLPQTEADNTPSTSVLSCSNNDVI